MADIVLVHGGFHGGWCFSRVARLLRQAGHEVFTPTLTGLGERSHLAHWPINLETHITDILNVILWEDLTNVVLAGHSYGGMVVTGVADRIPERIANLVYLDAGLPEGGETILAISPRARVFVDRAAANGGQFVPVVAARDFQVNEADQAWVDSKLVKHPLACFVQALDLTGRFCEVPRRTLAYALGADGSHTTRDLYEAYRGMPGYEVHAISPSGHDLMIDQPGLTAQAILAATAAR